MTFILTTEAAVEQPTVPGALQKLVSALREAEAAYSLDDVSAMLEAEIAKKPEQVLDEAGGLMSWVKRYVTGADSDVIEQIRSELPSIQTEKDKQDMLHFLDKLIAEVRSYSDRGTVNTAVRTGLAAYFTQFLSAGHKTGAAASKFDSEIAKKVGGAMGTTFTALGAFALIRLVANIFRIIRRNNGSAQEYLDALGAVRAEVDAIQIPKGE
jgi:hypothetical protein